jgi:hypothetical protein
MEPAALFPFATLCVAVSFMPYAVKKTFKYFEKSIKKYQKVSNVKKRSAPSNVAKCCPAVIAGLKREGVGAYPLKWTNSAIKCHLLKFKESDKLIFS